MPKVLNSRDHRLGEFSDSWDGSQSLRIFFYVVIDVCAKIVVLDDPKGGIDSSGNEESNPIKFLHPRGHAGERGKEFVRIWKEIHEQLYGLDQTGIVRVNKDSLEI